MLQSDCPKGNLIETGGNLVDLSMCDQMGHMTVREYATVFDEASYELVKACGLELDGETGFVDLEMNMKFINEIREGGVFYVKSGFVKLGTSSFTAMHYMFSSLDDSLIASCEEKAVIFDLNKRKSEPMSDEFKKLASGFLVD
ncbi:acyl-CoA thioesterase [Pseudemcibacter aquimaris]|uniref:acyl-CoA thioesterase n=1 Tax=Pseudemcibacter aquimaris TaxID=2857064 RepID=UPI002010CD43|nr:thioesterase family protein [Pseudemcibacter aquimaris]MCC3859992.1 thioesterase family protein [Pseudemcibacter aquimaris]WDU57323.1 thioesterase family protein [Pseudemcibacter aquimaris]